MKACAPALGNYQNFGRQRIEDGANHNAQCLRRYVRRYTVFGTVCRTLRRDYQQHHTRHTSKAWWTSTGGVEVVLYRQRQSEVQTDVRREVEVVNLPSWRFGLRACRRSGLAVSLGRLWSSQERPHQRSPPLGEASRQRSEIGEGGGTSFFIRTVKYMINNFLNLNANRLSSCRYNLSTSKKSGPFYILAGTLVLSTGFKHGKVSGRSHTIYE